MLTYLHRNLAVLADLTGRGRGRYAVNAIRVRDCGTGLYRSGCPLKRFGAKRPSLAISEQAPFPWPGSTARSFLARRPGSRSGPD
jgi:hypothetical protein